MSIILGFPKTRSALSIGRDVHFLSVAGFILLFYEISIFQISLLYTLGIVVISLLRFSYTSLFSNHQRPTVIEHEPDLPLPETSFPEYMIPIQHIGYHNLTILL